MSTYSPEAAAFYDHLFACRSCRAVAGHYCDEGQHLRRVYYVPHWVESLLRRPTREARARGLAACPADLRAEVEAEVRRQFAGGYTVPDADYLERQQQREARASLRRARREG
jgi:hypothetical protein